MSTNINNEGPSIESLQELANKFFSVLPGESIPGGFSPNIKDQGKENFSKSEEDFNLKNPRSSHVDPFVKDGIYIPQSNSGNGVNFAGKDGVEKANLHRSDAGNNIPFDQVNHSPKSQSGFGISPSAIEQGNAVNLKNPTTSFHDSSFNDLNTVPNLQSQHLFSPLESGSGFDSLPVSNIQVLDKFQSTPFGIREIQGFNSTASFPGTSGFADQFYFLQGKDQGSFLKDKIGQGQKDFSAENQVKGILQVPFNIDAVRNDFPILQERVNGKQLIWFDNAATTQKPKQVIDRIDYFYKHENSNIHRAAHELAARATDAYEGARTKVQHFLNARSVNEIVFVRGATEAINLVAKSWGNQNLNAGDEIIVSQLEHHANIVPWKQLADKKGLIIKVIPVDNTGQIILSEYGKLLGPKTKLVAVTQVSNALGTVTPIKEIIEMAHVAGARVLVDGAQSVSHLRVNLQYLNPDFFVFSGHKIFGPTGIGVLYGKEELLNAMPPWQGGGNMIQDVTFEKIIYHQAPGRFEAGTGNIADAVGLGAAIDYVNKIGIENIGHYEEFLLSYATRLLKDIPGIRLIGTAANKASVASFVLDGFKTEEVGSELNKQGIAVRSGHHCAQPILRRFGVETSVRPSFAFYNTTREIDVMIETLHKLTGRRKNF